LKLTSKSIISFGTNLLLAFGSLRKKLVGCCAKTTSFVTMSLTKMNNGSPHDDEGACPKCKESFDTDKSLMESSDEHRLPFTCSKCFDYTLCSICLDAVDWTSFECPICHKKQGFDRDDPVPNTRLCTILKKLEAAQNPAATPSSTTIVTPQVDRSLSEATPRGMPKSKSRDSSPAPPVTSTRPTRATRLPDSSQPIKTEKATPARHQPLTKNPAPRRRKKVVSSLNDEDVKVGARVYCRWPETDTFHWGHIVTIHERKNGATSYKVRNSTLSFSRQSCEHLSPHSPPFHLFQYLCEIVGQI